MNILFITMVLRDEVYKSATSKCDVLVDIRKVLYNMVVTIIDSVIVTYKHYLNSIHI